MQDDVKSVFDLDDAVHRCFGRHEVFVAMVASFFDEARPLLAEMQEALDCGDLDGVAQLAHRLRGTIVYLSAPGAARAAVELERTAGERAPEDAARGLERLADEVARLEGALASHRPH